MKKLIVLLFIFFLTLFSVNNVAATLDSKVLEKLDTFSSTFDRISLSKLYNALTCNRLKIR